MAKITRKNQLIFGSDAGSQGIVEYGSPALGTPVASTDPDDIQTAAWETGWAAAALAGTEIPTFQDFNAIHFVATRQLAYLLQEGIPEFSLETEYYQNSIVKKTGTYELYGSIGDANLGNALPSQADDANWQYLGDLSDLVNAGSNELLHVREEQPAGTDGSTVTGSGTYDTMVLNTVKTNEISGASVSTNQITLPSGTYFIDAYAVFYSESTPIRKVKSRLRNISDSSTEIVGASMGFGDEMSLLVPVSGRFTIASSKTFTLQAALVQSVASGDRWGENANAGEIEVYHDVKIWKVG